MYIEDILACTTVGNLKQVRNTLRRKRQKHERQNIASNKGWHFPAKRNGLFDKLTFFVSDCLSTIFDTWSDLDLMSYTELRATLPCWALAALPKVWKLFPPNFAQASQALLTEASPGPFSIFHHIFVYILNRGNVFVFTLRHHQKIKKAFQSKQVSGSVKHLVAIQAFFLVKVCFKYLLLFKSWHFATLLVPPNSTTKVSTW